VIFAVSGVGIIWVAFCSGQSHLLAILPFVPLKATTAITNPDHHVRLYKIDRLARPSSFIVHQSLAAFQPSPPLDCQ
jgi:hypothetical protein